ncbi:MAG: Fumarate reductase flavoprotein subunit [Steroidobacteraceae bacterium]|nr:Fumarate reductase flavoprotein subunit [Steroidobacteraceae bacterium]
MATTADFSVSRPCPLSQVPRFDFETDVAIVGFGAAGSCAAIEAAAAGAKVMLFEVSSGSGGAAALSGGEIYVGGGGGSLQQRTAGFEDRTEDFYQYLLMAGGPNADAAKVRLYADHALGHLDWLAAQGVEFKNSYIAERVMEPLTDDCLVWTGSEEAWPFAQAARPAPRGHTARQTGWSAGKYLMDMLAARVNAIGVDVRFDARALALVADEQQRVHGLVVRIDGTARYVRARGVVLCAGGFIMNREMVRRHAPHLLRADNPIGTTDNGSGVCMGMSVGGAAINMSEGFATVPWYPPGSLVKGIFVNERGQRFINEDCYHGRVTQFILEQPGDRIWLLQDQETYAQGLLHETARVEIGAAGDSWEEIEQELQLPEGTLTATVAVYNRHAARGEDPLFHKAQKWLKPLDKPPFVALDCRVDHAHYSAFTLGGLDTLPTGEVLTEERKVIPGLYAAGRTACGLPRWGKGYSSGMSIADSTFFGRQAGRQAARAAPAGG